MLEELDKSGVTQGIPIDELKEQVQEALFRNLPYIQYI
jgi:hypothetical protein